MKNINKVFKHIKAKTWSVPEVIHFGTINHRPQKGDLHSTQALSYFIMPRYGENLEFYFEHLEKKLSTISILKLGKKIIDIL